MATTSPTVDAGVFQPFSEWNMTMASSSTSQFALAWWDELFCFQEADHQQLLNVVRIKLCNSNNGECF